MFAYCGNNPVIYADPSGRILNPAINSRYEATNIDGLNSGAGGAGGASLIITIAAFDAIEELAGKIKAWVAAAEGTSERRNHHVYVLQDPNSDYLVKYVGRTNDPARREREHRNDFRHPERADYRMLVLVSGMTKEQAMLLEQVLISAFSLSHLENARREIAAGNVGKYTTYMTSVAEIITGATEDALINLIRE